jgi:hypothetical protein
MDFTVESRPLPAGRTARGMVKLRGMPAVVPVNSLEIQLRALLTDKNTPYWSFYTPLAAAPLWIITQNYPELDGSDQGAPEGKDPGICVFNGPEYSCVGLYTAQCRVEEAFERMKLSRTMFRYVSAPGYQLLKFLKGVEFDYIWINAGMKEFQYCLDPDMVEILLSRPEPDYKKEPGSQVELGAADDLYEWLGPLKEFLSRRPKVRAAWVLAEKLAAPLPPGQRAYQIGLVMADPEDNSLLHQVGVMAKALTPVEVECTPTILMADDQALRNLAKKQPPFYEAPGFLKG